jgi:hypothetical protein
VKIADHRHKNSTPKLKPKSDPFEHEARQNLEKRGVRKGLGYFFPAAARRDSADSGTHKAACAATLDSLDPFQGGLILYPVPVLQFSRPRSNRSWRYSPLAAG